MPNLQHLKDQLKHLNKSDLLEIRNCIDDQLDVLVVDEDQQGRFNYQEVVDALYLVYSPLKTMQLQRWWQLSVGDRKAFCNAWAVVQKILVDLNYPKKVIPKLIAIGVAKNPLIEKQLNHKNLVISVKMAIPVLKESFPYVTDPCGVEFFSSHLEANYANFVHNMLLESNG